MDVSVLSTVLFFVTSLCCFGTGTAAFRRYSTTKSDRLFITGIMMIIIAVGIISGALDIIFPLSPYALEWPSYLGTSVGYFMFFLSSIMNSTEQFRILKRWSTIAATAFVILFPLSTSLPHLDDNRSAIVAFNVLRTIICSLIFFRYLMLYTSKGTRFSLFLCLAFLFIGISYITIIVQTLEAVTLQLPFIDLMICAIGDALLFVAFVAG